MTGTKVVIRTRCNDVLQWPFDMSEGDYVRIQAEERIHRLARRLGGTQGDEDGKGFYILFSEVSSAEHFESQADQIGFTTERT